MVDTDDCFCQVIRYVERNALRANLENRTEDWQWSSLWIREFGDTDHRKLLSTWPVIRSRDWAQHVNQPLNAKELEAIRQSCNRGTPHGGEEWVNKTIRKFGLESTERQPGRLRKHLMDLSPFLPAVFVQQQSRRKVNCGIVFESVSASLN